MTAVNPAIDAPADTGHTAHATHPGGAAAEPKPYGVIGEFDDVTAVTRAAEATRDAGYVWFDVHSPFPIHGIDDAIGIKPTILPWIVLGGGLTGMATGLVLTWFTMASSFALPGPPGVPPQEGYQYFISAKPYMSLPAFIPVIFELTILLASFGAVFGMLLLNKLPTLSHPLFTSARFRRATADRFYLAIEAKDQRFDAEDTAAFLKEHGALETELVEERYA